VDGVGADRARRADQVDTGQAGGPAEERFGGDADAGRDGSAQVIPFARDAVEGGGRAEIYDAGRAA